MNLADVMDEIGDAVDRIPGLNVYRWPADEITPPAAVVAYPSIDLDAAFQRGLDRWTGALLVLVDRVFDKATRDQMSELMSGDGPRSIVEAFWQWDWQACDYARPVSTTDPDVITVAGVDYLGYAIQLDIAGPGRRQEG